MKIPLSLSGTALYGIVGFPLGHSLSPTLHNWAFDLLGIAGQYHAFALQKEELPAFMAQVRTLPVAGLSVTIPYKEAIQDLLDTRSVRAQTIGAVNTVYWKGQELAGENTDSTGFMRPLQSQQGSFRSALVLGAGGAARGVIAGLQALGVADIVISNRTAHKATVLAQTFDIRTCAWADRADQKTDIIINTTALGMQGQGPTNQEESPWPEDRAFASDQLLYDIVYRPLQTKFLQQGLAAGCRVIDGLDMFIYQAMEQFLLWTGESFPYKEARSQCLIAMESNGGSKE